MVLLDYKTAINKIQETYVCNVDELNILNFGFIGIPDPDVKVKQIHANIKALTAMIKCLSDNKSQSSVTSL
ncbi:MAG: hypothetical protein H6625_03315 [Bdellovibrionaceae bacterium]|nr:hypothetical protein [Pseudobdellovibrionaceae bacterium]